MKKFIMLKRATILLVLAAAGLSLVAQNTVPTRRAPGAPITNTVVITNTPGVTNVVVTNTVIPAPGGPGGPAVTPATDSLRQRLRALTNNTGTAAAPGTAIAPPGFQQVPTRGTNVTTATPPGIRTTPSTSGAPAVAQPGTIPPGVSPPPGATVPGPGQIPAIPRPGVRTNAAPATVAATRVADPMDTTIIPAQRARILNMPLDQVFDVYAGYSGRTVLRSSALPGTATITLNVQSDLTQREMVQALDSVLALNGIAMINLGEKFVKAVAANTAPQEGSELSRTAAKELPMAEQFVTQVVQLKTVAPSVLQPILGTFSKNPTGITPIDASGVIVLRDYASNVKRMLEIIEKVDVMPESDYQLEVIPIKYGKVTDLFDTMNFLTGGGGASGGTAGGMSAAGGMGAAGRPQRRTPTRPTSGSTYNSGRTAGGMNMGAGGVQPFQSGGGAFAPGGAAPAVGGQSSFQDRLRQIVSRAATGGEVQVLGDARIVPDERSNSLLVYASKQDMAMITNIVARVDTMLAQVLIEAIIMEVNITDDLSMGVSLLQNPKRAGDFVGGGLVNNSPASLAAGRDFFGGLGNAANLATNLTGAGGFSYFGKLGGSLEAAVSMIATDRRGNVLSRPRIQTSHAVPGNVFLGNSVPYVTGTYDYGFGVGGGGSRSQYQEKEIGINLYVTPFITPEGLVVMEVEQSFDSQAGDVEIDGNPVPIINKRQDNSIQTVRDGDTIMLGGFISENKSRTSSGVPILKDIPIIGAAFRSKTRSDERTELIVLMRARVLQTPDEAAFVANEERIRSPLLKKADYEIETDNRKRLQKIDDELRRSMEKDYRQTAPPLNTPGNYTAPGSYPIKD